MTPPLLPAALLVLTVGAQVDEHARVFDQHWQRLRDDYPFFERYGVDWDAERDEHRPRAIAAATPDAFAWEVARMLTCLRDPHVEFLPSPAVMVDWSIPDVRLRWIEGRMVIVGWDEANRGVGPKRYREVERVCPEVLAVEGTPVGSAVEMLAAGPVGTEFTVRLRWPDGTETDETLRRPLESNMPPTNWHLGEDWIASGRVGSIGYLRVRTFAPSRATLDPEGKMTPILRRHLRSLASTEGLILDLQGNGGGQVGASDPFLGHFLKKRASYRWGNSNGRRRVLRPNKPRYSAPVVAIVDEATGSGGEWAAWILRNAGRATVVGGRTIGAEAAVRRSNGSDGSMVMFSAWPMAEPGYRSFQDVGIEVDVALPLTIADVRRLGYDEARKRIERKRYARAVELLGGEPSAVDAIGNDDGVR